MNELLNKYGNHWRECGGGFWDYSLNKKKPLWCGRHDTNQFDPLPSFEWITVWLNWWLRAALNVVSFCIGTQSRRRVLLMFDSIKSIYLAFDRMAGAILETIWWKQVEGDSLHSVFSISQKQGRARIGQWQVKRWNQSTVGQRPEPMRQMWIHWWNQ